MEDIDSINERIQNLRKNISLLEWDIPNIKNEVIRSKKEEFLRECKQELSKFIWKKSPIDEAS